jgi:hypothetical protein
MRRFYKCKWSLFKSKKLDSALKTGGVDRAMVKEAGEELRQAYQTLALADNNDMVDYAVFTLQAAEKRYGYLLKKLKEQEKQESFIAKGGEI